MRRRSFLRRSVAVAGSLALSSSALAGSVTAETDPYDAQPEHVSLVYDESLLEEHVPRLVMSHLDVSPTAAYSWIATSTEHSTDFYCYWVYYAYQEGYTEYDSHETDREPVLVEVNQDDEVVAVYYDAYHYLRNDPGTAPVRDGHPTLRIQKPHHFYTATTAIGDMPDIGDLHEYYDAWIDNDWRVYRPAVVDPWSMASREHFWRDASAGVSFNAVYWRSLLAASSVPGIDFGGASDSDLS
ncbi:MAG: hypothetical protein ACOCSN_05195 [Halanaeroarchaeum sp.]